MLVYQRVLFTWFWKKFHSSGHWRYIWDVGTVESWFSLQEKIRDRRLWQPVPYMKGWLFVQVACKICWCHRLGAEMGKQLPCWCWNLALHKNTIPVLSCWHLRDLTLHGNNINTWFVNLSGLRAWGDQFVAIVQDVLLKMVLQCLVLCTVPRKALPWERWRTVRWIPVPRSSDL